MLELKDNTKEDCSSKDLFESEETVCAAPGKKNVINTCHRLIALSGDPTQKTYLLDQPKIMIGRDKSSHIRIHEKTASLYHAMICIQDNVCILKDLNSKNGTIVNGSGVKDSLILKDGDKITIGFTLFAFLRGDLGHVDRAGQLPRRNRTITSIYPIAVNMLKSVSALLARSLGDLGQSLWARRLLREKRLATSVIGIASIIILAILFSLSQTNSGDSRSPEIAVQQMSVANNLLGRKNMIRASEAGTTQQKISSAKDKDFSLNETALQLIEKSIRHYIKGDIALSLTMVEETLHLNLPDDSSLKTKALAVKDSVGKVYMLYKEGLDHYSNRRKGQAIVSWSKALKADQKIVGPQSSHLANQIANHTGDIFYQMAQNSLNRGNDKEAQEFCSQTFRAQPGHKGCTAIMNTL
jgi:hypothetical protein